MDNFIRRKKRSGPKNFKKMGFLGFSHITAPKRFAILLLRSDDSQTYKIVAHLNLKGAPTIKEGNFIRKKIKFWARKCQKMGFLRVFTHYCTKSLRNFTVLLWWCSNLQDSCLFDRARCASNKMDNFIGRKKFWAKKLQKNGFFWVFTHYCTKSLRNFTLALRWFSNLQDTRPLEFERCANYKKRQLYQEWVRL